MNFSLYAAEQLILVSLINITNVDVKLIGSIFAIIVLATFGIHRLIIDSRMDIIFEHTRHVDSSYDQLAGQMQDVIERNQMLYRELERYRKK